MDELLTWWRAGESVGVGTVVAPWRSSPRPAGASMLVGPGGEAVGSVSGGCVEGAVSALVEQVAADVEAGRPVAVCTVIEHPDPAHLGRRLVVRPDDVPEHARDGTLGSARADDAVGDDARGLLASGRTETLTFGPD